MRTLIFSFILGAIILVGCGNQRFEKTFDFKNNMWQRFEPVEFNFENSTIEKPYTINVIVELTNEYEFDDFRFTLNRENANGETWIKSWFIPIKNAQQEMDAKPENGIYVYKMTLTRQMYFSEKSSHKFIITNLLPKVENRGIKSMRIIIEN